MCQPTTPTLSTPEKTRDSISISMSGTHRPGELNTTTSYMPPPIRLVTQLVLPIPEKTEPEVELPKTEIRNRNVERKSPALVYVRLTRKEVI